MWPKLIECSLHVSHQVWKHIYPSPTFPPRSLSLPLFTITHSPNWFSHPPLIDSPFSPSLPPSPPVTWRLAVTRLSLSVLWQSLSGAPWRHKRSETRKTAAAPHLFLFFLGITAFFFFFYLFPRKISPESAEAAGKRYSVKRVIFSHPLQRWVAGSRLWDRLVLLCGKWSPLLVLSKNEVEAR